MAEQGPIARQNAKILPVKMPFQASGTEIVKKIRNSEAPNVRATSSIL